MVSEEKDASAQIKALLKKYRLTEKEWETLKFYNMDNKEEIDSFIHKISTNEEKINEIQDDIQFNKKELVEIQNPSQELLDRFNLPTNKHRTLETEEEGIKNKINELESTLEIEQRKDRNKIFNISEFTDTIQNKLREMEQKKYTEMVLDLARHATTMSSDELKNEIDNKFDIFDATRTLYSEHSGEYKKTLIKLTGRWHSLNAKQKKIMTTNNEPFSLKEAEIPEITNKVEAIKQTISYCEKNFQDKFKEYKGNNPDDFLKNFTQVSLPESTPQPVKDLDNQLFAAALKIAYHNLHPMTQTSTSESAPPSPPTESAIDNNSSTPPKNINKNKQRVRSKSEIIKQQFSTALGEVKRRFSSNLGILTRNPNAQVKKTDSSTPEGEKESPALNTEKNQENKSSNSLKPEEKTSWQKANVIKKQVNTSSAAVRDALKRSKSEVVEVVKKKYADSKFKTASVSNKKSAKKSSLSSHRKFTPLTEEEKKICQNYNLSHEQWEVLKIYDLNNEPAIKQWADNFKGKDTEEIPWIFKKFSEYSTKAHTNNADKIVQTDRELAIRLAIQFPDSNTSKDELTAHLKNMIEDPNNNIKKSYDELFNRSHKIVENVDALKSVMANLTGRLKPKEKYYINNETLDEGILQDKIINQLERDIIGNRYINDARNALPACNAIINSWVSNGNTLDQDIFDDNGAIKKDALAHIKNEHPDTYNAFLKNTTAQTLLFKQLLQVVYNNEKSKYAPTTIQKENIQALKTVDIENVEPLIASTVLSQTTIPSVSSQGGLMMGWNKTTSKPLGFEDITAIQQCSVQKIHDFAMLNQKEYHIKEVKKLPEEGKKMTGIEIKFESDNSKAPISAYVYNEKNQSTKFSISKNLSGDAATEAILKTCRLAVSAAGPNARFNIPDTLSDEKRDMVKGCFSQAIQEALQKPNSIFTQDTKPQIITSLPNHAPKQQLK